MKEFIEKAFGIKDSELEGWEYNIPEGYTASIENGKIIVKKEECEDEKIRKEILEYFQQFENEELRGVNISDWLAWLEKQGEQKPVDFKAKDWYVSKVDGKIHNMTYNHNKGPAWSEDDEEMLDNAIFSINHESVIEGLKSRGISYSIDSSAHLVGDLINWFKSLKQRLKGE